MARKAPGPSLFLDGRIWHYRFTRDGVRIQRSTKTTIPGRAERIAWLAYYGEKAIPTLGVLAREWVEAHFLTHSPGHVRSVGVFLRNHLYGLGSVRIDMLTTDLVEAARARHLASGRAPASVNLWLRILKLLCNWAVKREVISKVPWRVKMLKLQKKPRATLPVAKEMAWLAVVDRICGQRVGIAAAIRMMLAFGLREREALTARWEWIDWERSVYRPGETKNREADPVPMPPWLVDHLHPRKKPAGLIVVSPRGGAYAPGATRAVILKASAEVGVYGMSPHKIRNSFATRLSVEGVPLPDIQEAMRHKDSRTTLGYIEKDMGRVAKAQEEIARRAGHYGRDIGGTRGSKPREGLKNLDS